MVQDKTSGFLLIFYDLNILYRTVRACYISYINGKTVFGKIITEKATLTVPNSAHRRFVM